MRRTIERVLKCVDRREVGRRCTTHYIDIAIRIDGDATTLIPGTAPEKCGVHQRLAGRRELDDEGITRPLQARLKSVARWEINRRRSPCDIGAASSIRGQPPGEVKLVASEVGRIAQDRINDEWFLHVIRTHLETYLVVVEEDKPPGDFAPLSLDPLVNVRPVQAQFSLLGMDHQVAARAQLDSLRPLVPQANLLRVRARLDNEVVLQLALVCGVIHQVNPRYTSAKRTFL